MRIAVITGAASGSGLAIAQRLAEEGYGVALVDIDAAGGKAAEEQIRAKGHKAGFFQCDVASADQVQAMAQAIGDEHDKIDVLVNNAGIGLFGSLDEFSPEDWDRQMEVNAKSVFLVTKYLLNLLRKGSEQSIINIGSGAGVIGVGNSIGYCASKGALVVMSKAMALDLAPEGMRVNALCPGVVDTPFNDAILATMDDPSAVLEAQRGAHPLGRLATAEDVADAAAFLSSNQASFITGTTFMVDGGLTAQ